MAPFEPERVALRGPLLGVERTWRAGGQTSEFEPERTCVQSALFTN